MQLRGTESEGGETGDQAHLPTRLRGVAESGMRKGDL